MPFPTRLLSPSLEGVTSSGKLSLYDSREDFISRVALTATAAIYFGGFTLTPPNSALSRQALYKLSFLHRHFLAPAGLKIEVRDRTAVLNGDLTSRRLRLLAEILAHQIEGIEQIQDETGVRPSAHELPETIDSIQLLFATDQTLFSGVQVSEVNGKVILDGTVNTPTQRAWAEQLAEAVVSPVESRLGISTFTPPPQLKASQPPLLDDESMEALVLFRLRLVRDTASLTLKVKANRGVVTLQGKVPSEAQRQRVENIARSTLGIRELRSTLSIAG